MSSAPPPDVRPVADDWSAYLRAAAETRNDPFHDEYVTGNIRHRSGDGHEHRVHLDPFTLEAIRVAELGQMSGGEFAIVLPTPTTTAAVPMALALLLRYGRSSPYGHIPEKLVPKEAGRYVHRKEAKVLIVSAGIELRELYLGVATKAGPLADHFSIGQYRRTETGAELRPLKKGQSNVRMVFCSQTAQLSWIPRTGFTAAVFEHSPRDSFMRTSQVLEYAKASDAELKVHLVALPTSPAAARLRAQGVPIWMWSHQDILRLVAQDTPDATRTTRFAQPRSTLQAIASGAKRTIREVPYGELQEAFLEAGRELRDLRKRVPRSDPHAWQPVMESYQVLQTLANLSVTVKQYDAAAGELQEYELSQALRSAAEGLHEISDRPGLEGAGRAADALQQAFASLKRGNPKAKVLQEVVNSCEGGVTVAAHNNSHAHALRRAFSGNERVQVILVSELEGATLPPNLVFTGLPSSSQHWRLGLVLSPSTVFLEDPASGRRQREIVDALDAIEGRNVADGLRLEFLLKLKEGERGRHKAQAPRALPRTPALAPARPVRPAEAPANEPDVLSLLVPEDETFGSSAGEGEGAATGSRAVEAVQFLFEDGSRLFMRPRADMSRDIPGKGTEQIEAQDIQQGMRVFVFLDGARQNLFSSILEKAENHSALREHRDNIRSWQEAMRHWLGPGGLAYGNLVMLHKRFLALGVQKELSTLAAWAEGDRIGPARETDLDALARVIEDKDLARRVPAIWKSINKVRQLHMVVGSRISKALSMLSGSGRDEDSYIDKTLGITVDDFLGTVDIKTVNDVQRVSVPAHLIGIYEPAGA